VLPALTLTGVSGILIALLDHPSRSVATSPVSIGVRAGTEGSVASSGDPATCGGPLVDGPAIDTKWGEVQVAVTVAADGALCDVEALKYPTTNRRSASLNEQVLPVLHDRAISDGANFDAVSGATVTSEGYRASLQAALDR
jgi:hypothetical protein